MKTYVVTAQAKPDHYYDNVSKGDVTAYTVDFTPWQEDNHTITSVTWTLEAGNGAISGAALVSGVASALFTTSDTGRSLISITANSATEKKRIWLEVLAKDVGIYTDDYGLGA